MTRAYCAKHARSASVRHTSSFVAVVRTVANGHGASDSHTSATPLERPFLRGALSPAARDPHRSLWLPARERYASVLGRLARRRITSRAGWDTPRRERVALPAVAGARVGDVRRASRDPIEEEQVVVRGGVNVDARGRVVEGVVP